MVVVTGFSVVVGSVLHEPYKELKLGKIPQSHLLFFFPRTLHEPYKELKLLVGYMVDFIFKIIT